MVPPESVQRQYQLYDEFNAASTQDEQALLMREILAITADDFHVIGVMFPIPTITIAKNNFRNLPESLILSWSYPSDSPVGVEQFFFD